VLSPGVLVSNVLILRASMSWIMPVILMLPLIFVSLGINDVIILRYATGLVSLTISITRAPCLWKSLSKQPMNARVTLALDLCAISALLACSPDWSVCLLVA